MATTSYAQGATGSKGVQLNPAPAPAAQQPTFTALQNTPLPSAITAPSAQVTQSGGTQQATPTATQPGSVSVLNYYLPGTYTNPMTGASVASVSATALTIDIVFTLNFGTTLQGLTGSTGLTGFRVLRSGVAQTITAAVVQSTNTIRLSGVFLAGDVVDYIDVQNPTITNNVYTNASVNCNLEQQHRWRS